MKKYDLKCGVIFKVIADNINDAEKKAKKRFNTKDTKFHQLIDYNELERSSSQSKIGDK
jgi:hypothetical protein